MRLHGGNWLIFVNALRQWRCRKHRTIRIWRNDAYDKCVWRRSWWMAEIKRFQFQPDRIKNKAMKSA